MRQALLQMSVGRESYLRESNLIRNGPQTAEVPSGSPMRGLVNLPDAIFKASV